MAEAADLSLSLARALVALCVIASALGFIAWSRRAGPYLGRMVNALGLVCLALGVVTWIVRWAAAGHLPLFGTYESALSLAVATLLGGLLVMRRSTGPAGLWPVVTATTAVIAAHGLSFDPTPYALTISERSWVVDVHAVAAWAAFGGLAINAAVALRRLAGGSDSHAPSDRLLTFTLSLGFVMHSAMMVTGSFYKFLLFGRVWSFDPIETLGLVAWVSYGTLLHMQLFAGWQGRRLAAWCLALFVLLVISYRGIVYFPAWSTYHIFDMDLRIHLTGSETLQ
jgi:ABC-type transport system involved in cytochrome c biogenesis permease subunit